MCLARWTDSVLRCGSRGRVRCKSPSEASKAQGEDGPEKFEGDQDVSGLGDGLSRGCCCGAEEKDVVTKNKIKRRGPHRLQLSKRQETRRRRWIRGTGETRVTWFHVSTTWKEKDAPRDGEGEES